MRQKVLIIGTILATALFVLIGRFTNVPLGFGGQRIAFEFAILGFAAAALGPLPGICVGLIGMFILNYLLGRLWWSEIIAAMFMGCIIGLCERRLALISGGFENRRLFNYAGFAALAGLFCYVLVCPTMDAYVYDFGFGETMLYWLCYGASALLCAILPGGLLCYSLGNLCKDKPLVK
ncbi:MAG: ECF transporter S component [Lachnospiraceae bacterium]|nr:ECF transporter S component [Lachnospiraceae bacterium]